MERKRDSFFLSKKQGKKADGRNGDKPAKINKREEQFDRNRGVKPEKKELENNGDGKPEKKEFDKKKYRLKKYSKKYKLEQWEEKRKKKMLHDFYKETKNDDVPGTYKPVSFDEDVTDSIQQEAGKFVRHPDLMEKDTANKQIVKKVPYLKAKERYDKIKQVKVEKQKEIEKTKEERQQKLAEYKKKKQERFKKLSKKTKKGQPVMTGRLEILLEKIQKGSK